MSELFSNENIFINVSVGSQNEAIEKAGQALDPDWITFPLASSVPCGIAKPLPINVDTTSSRSFISRSWYCW
jgi:hypothetical protein